MRNLTPLQGRVLGAMVAHGEEKGYPATIGELARRCSIRHEVASRTVASLERWKYVTRDCRVPIPLVTEDGRAISWTMETAPCE